MICSSSFWNFGSAFLPIGRALVQVGDQIGRDAVILVVWQGIDLLELDGVIHLPLAELALIVHRGDVDVGGNAVDLGAVAVGPEELLDRQLEGSAVRVAAVAATRMALDRDDALHGPFAERAGIADDQATAVVLDHAREDLGGAGAGLVDQDDERAIPGRPFLVVEQLLDAEDFLDLDDRAGVDEESGERLGLFQQAAAVAPEIHHDRVDAFLLEIFEDLAAIGGRTHGVRIAAEDRHRCRRRRPGG